ncbi:sensor histidine kinase [Nocardioides aequoreus]|uniref:sensor histidine kinase n=1 Tax=Nocardioides aequoreus TaxID=397278 RepID=UPI00068B6140|nr:histidine kinase [Nocardioides aequoreus]
MSDVGRAALAARAFVLAVLLPLAALSQGADLRLTLVVAAVAALATLVTSTTQVAHWQVAAAEAVPVALVAVVAYPATAAVAPYLVVPALVAALDGGRSRLAVVVGLEAALMALAWLVVLDAAPRRELLAGGTLWLAAAVGVGTIGVALQRALTPAEDDQPYRSAVGLIRRLEALSGRLSGGLDAVGISEEIMDLAEEQVPLRSAGVFVRSSGGSVVPVRYTAGTAPGAMGWAAEMSERCWEYEAMMLRERRLALPLAVNDEIVGVLVLDAVQPVEAAAVPRLRSELARPTVQLQAALLFGRVRDAAMAQERQRIAREVHDGVAQDVAGLGYLVDNLVAQTRDAALHEHLLTLRREVSKIVTELRYSVFDLRQEQASTAGLGESIATYANQISATSAMTVHLTLDEEGSRLPRDQEFELMRIALEAMTNARKHSGAGNLWVRCAVRAPYAEVEVTDDGVRAHAPRSDSQGLKIMRERAHAIGADLTLEPPGADRPGTRVLVRVGTPPT